MSLHVLTQAWDTDTIIDHKTTLVINMMYNCVLYATTSNKQWMTLRKREPMIHQWRDTTPLILIEAAFWMQKDMIR